MSSENATRAAKMTTTTINAPMIVKMFSIFEKSFAFGICVVGGILQHSTYNYPLSDQMFSHLMFHPRMRLDDVV